MRHQPRESRQIRMVIARKKGKKRGGRPHRLGCQQELLNSKIPKKEQGKEKKSARDENKELSRSNAR